MGMLGAKIELVFKMELAKLIQKNMGNYCLP